MLIKHCFRSVPKREKKDSESDRSKCGLIVHRGLSVESGTDKCLPKEDHSRLITEEEVAIGRVCFLYNIITEKPLLSGQSWDGVKVAFEHRWMLNEGDISK